MRIARYWMTGCMALVVLAANQWSTRQEDNEARAQRRGLLSIDSPFPPDQTADKLIQEAHSRGISVIAQVDGPSGYSDSGRGSSRVLVFGTRDGNTPVLQGDGTGELNLPMKLIVERDASGQTTVLFEDPDTLSASRAVPGDVLDKVAALPGLIDAALLDSAPRRPLTSA